MLLNADEEEPKLPAIADGSWVTFSSVLANVST